MAAFGKPSPPASNFLGALEGIVEKLHTSAMTARMKAKIARDVAHVHEVEGRVFDAAVAVETAYFFHPTRTLARDVMRVRRKLTAPV